MNITPSDLSGFHCTENYFKTMLPNLWYSDGFQYFCRNGGEQGAYWFLDLLQFELLQNNTVKQEDFLVVEMTVDKSAATIKIQDGNNNYLVTKDIAFTDLASGCWKFYVEGTYCGDIEGKLIYLPSER